VDPSKITTIALTFDQTNRRAFLRRSGLGPLRAWFKENNNISNPEKELSMTIILNIVFGILFYALAIWIVSKLGLGLKVSGFMPALIAAVVITVASWLIVWLLGILGLSVGGFIGAVIYLVIAALVLMFAGNKIKGLKVGAFVPALIGAVAIAIVSWLIDGMVGLLF